MQSQQTPIKQIAAGRRKPDMTRKEFFDHRFRIHGSISDDPEDKDSKPHKYIQTQVFDSAFGSRPDGPLNANHPWVGRDDTTELYFRDWDHIKKCFESEQVKKVIGPDGKFFADFESSIVLMASEKNVPLPTRLAEKGVSYQGNPTVAMYFISTPDGALEGKAVEKVVTPLLVRALQSYCQDEAWDLIVNVGEVSEHFDLKAYFGGDDSLPRYALVYKVYLKDQASVPQVRRSQKVFEDLAKEHIDQHQSFILFSKEALVLDVGNNVPFSRDRQPSFSELPGQSHLDFE